MEFNDLTPEQREKAKACTSAEELIALAQEEGVDLTDEQIEGLAGGREWYDCPYDCPSFSSQCDLLNT